MLRTFKELTIISEGNLKNVHILLNFILAFYFITVALGHISKHDFKFTKRGRSQDGVLGGRGICVSSQLGHLPGTGGGPWTPEGTGGTPSDRVGCGAWGE